MSKKRKEKGAFDDIAFQALENEFQQTLKELLGDQSLQKFRTEYEKLYNALNKSHDSERRLMNRCRDLNAEMVSNSAKVAAAVKLGAQDQETINSLKQEIGKTWKLLDAAHEKETRSKETIQSLKQEIGELSKLVEKGVGLLPGQEASLTELLRTKEEMTGERDQHLLQITGLREQLCGATTQLTQLEQQKAEVEEKLQELTHRFHERGNELQRESRKRDRLQRELKQAHADLDARHGEMRDLTARLEQTKAHLATQDKLVKEEKTISERAMKDAEVLTHRCDKLKADLEEQIHLADAMATENQMRATEIKHKEEEVHSLKTETQKLSRLTETMQRKLRQVEEQKMAAETDRDTLHSQVTAMERELEATGKQTAIDKKATDGLIRERDVLKKHMKKATGMTEKQEHLVKVHEQSKRILEQEIGMYKEEAQKQRKIIYQLEQERDRYINEASDLTQKVLQHMEELKMREMLVFDLKKKLAESDTKLKQQQNLYEAVRSDRNLYSKSLIECQDEITENRRKLTILNHQLSQLKEEIRDKESALLKEQLSYSAVEKEKEALKIELQRMKRQMAEEKVYLDAQKVETDKLVQVIAEADAVRLQQKKELDKVISERDILGTQLVHRNDEVSVLYEKIKLQESLLNRGEVQYYQRLDDLALLKREIRNLRRQNTVMKKKTAILLELQREVQQAEKQLMKERARCKALEEELENPMNVHRWRTLEGTAPKTYDLLQKTLALQKRLIRKTEEVVEKEQMIQDKEKVYLELRTILARQPGPEAAEQLLLYQQTLREKTKQMKALTSELNMTEVKVSDYQHQLTTVGRELHVVKKKYFALKKREQQAKEDGGTAGKTDTPAIQSQKSNQPRFTGGGFNFEPGKTRALPSPSSDRVVKF